MFIDYLIFLVATKSQKTYNIIIKISKHIVLAYAFHKTKYYYWVAYNGNTKMH